MAAWNKGKRVGQKKAFKLEDIWRIRIRLELEERLFELALFNLAVKVRGVYRSGLVLSRATVRRRKTRREVHFKLRQATPPAITVAHKCLPNDLYVWNTDEVVAT